VQIVSPQTTFSETIVDKKKEPEAPAPAEPVKPAETTPARESRPQTTKPAPLPAEEETGSGMNWLPVIIAAAIVLFGAVLIPMLVARKRG